MSDKRSDDWRRVTEDAFAKLPIGIRFSYTRTFSLADVAAFVAATGDFNPLHQDESHAKLRFGGLILPGLLTGSMLTHIGGLGSSPRRCTSNTSRPYTPGRRSRALSALSIAKRLGALWCAQPISSIRPARKCLSFV